MISIYFSGRTGNQMFQYAFARKLIEERGRKDSLFFNFNLVRNAGKTDSGFIDTFKDFNILHHKIDNRNLVLYHASFLQKFIWFSYHIDSKIHLSSHKELLDYWFNCFVKKGLLFAKYSDNDVDEMCSANIYNKILELNKLVIYGKFENPKFFDSIRSILQEEFTPIHKERTVNKSLYNVIRNSNSICVHVRRGDFLSDTFKKDFYVCDNGYFQRAIELIKAKVKNPTFIFFSNDIEWVKKNFKIAGSSYFESGNDPAWETFRLMYSCKHFIISNSTFSWWAQYLSRNPNKIVVSPDHWYNNPEMNKHARLIRPEFIKIPVEWH